MKDFTTRMNEGELRLFASQISKLQASGSGGIQRALSMKEEIDSTQPVGEYPEHWVD